MSGDPWQATFGPWVAHNGGPRPDDVAEDAMVQVHLRGSREPELSAVPARQWVWGAAGASERNGDIIRYRVQRAPVREVIGLYHRGEREPFATVVFIDGKADWTTVRMME